MDFFIQSRKNSSSAKLFFVISFFLSALLFIPAFQQLAYGISANPEVFDINQPDGTAIRLHIRGDEFFNWYEDLEGYTVFIDSGEYVYASLDIQGRLTPTNLVVGRDNPGLAGLGKRILPSSEIIRLQMPQQMQTLLGQGPSGVPPLGTVKNLIVLCLFSDHNPNLRARPQNDYDILFNQIGGDPGIAPTGSVKDLYLENSYGIMTLNSTVAAWVTLPYTEAYYANGSHGLDGSFPNNAQGMVRDALNLVDPLIDFSQFDDDSDGYVDAIDIIHSGYGAETGGGGGNWIWSHRWSLWQLPGSKWTSNEGVKVYDYHTEPALWGTSGTNIVRFGVIAHETGHFFGLPDLYDTDHSGEGIGSWGMMANSWGFDSSQLHPPHFCAWSKIELGWVSPTVIGVPGVYDINQVETNAEIYRIDKGYPSNEYLLIENRQPVGIETAIPQGGLCIFHIDDNAGFNEEGYPGQSGWPENGKHYRVAVLQADGNYNLEKGNNRGDSGDVYHGNGVSIIGPLTVPNTDAYQGGTIIVTNNEITVISVSGSMMSFIFTSNTKPPVASAINASTLFDTPVTINLEATDDGKPDPPGKLTYIITSLPADGNLIDANTTALISSVPYLLADFGDKVIYEPNVGFVGEDEFSFKANDGGSEPNGGDSQIAAVYLTVVGPPKDFSVDFEDGLGVFSIDNSFGDGGGLWHITSSCQSVAGGHSGINSLYYGKDSQCDYDVGNTEGVVTSETINLVTAKPPIVLHFNYYLETEGWLTSDFDNVEVQISQNGGSFVAVASNKDPSLSDPSGGWIHKEIDISEYADSVIQLRFSFRTGDLFYNNYDGFYIDDVTMCGTVSGDFEPDCDVDFYDYAYFAPAWMTGLGDDNYKPMCDISEPADDFIDVNDLEVFVGNWLKGK